MGLFGPPSKDDTKSYNPRWKAVPGLLFFLYFIFVFASKAASEKDVASRQQISSGLVAECKHSNRGANYWHYSFSTGDQKHYRGLSQAASEIELGQTVTVYYDSQNPRVNALEDFRKKEPRG